MLRRNFIGSMELSLISDQLDLNVPEVIPDVPYSNSILEKLTETHLLILMVPEFKDGTKVSIMSMRNKFGIDPEIDVPCFYNQDWYVKESFANKGAELKWLLFSKQVIDTTRALLPEQILSCNKLPSAVECVYAFFINYLVSNGEKLWDGDYVWCSDSDDKGDRIYVGRYTDLSGANKDGFEIHRHLSIKNNYGAIDYI